MATARRKKRKKEPKLPPNLRYEIAGLFVLTAGLFIMFALAYPSRCGIIGRSIVTVLHGFIGRAAAYGALGATYLGVVALWRKEDSKITLKSVGLLLLIQMLATAYHLPVYEKLMTVKSVHAFSQPVVTGWQTGQAGAGGGAIGGFFTAVFMGAVGSYGTYILLTVEGIIGVLLLTQWSLVSILRFLSGSTVAVGKKVYRDLVDYLNDEDGEEEPERGRTPAVTLASGPVVSVPSASATPSKTEIPIISFDEPRRSEQPAVAEKTTQTEKTSAGEKGKSPKTKGTGESNLPEIKGGNQLADYMLPPFTLLPASNRMKNPKDQKEIHDNIEILTETLKSFGITAQVNQVARGPAITRYELQLAPGIKVSRVIGLADDISLSLAASGVRIEAPIPGKAAVGIEVPNKVVSPVLLRDVLECPEFLEARSPLSVALGKDIAGNTIIADLLAMPHLLIAGATGSGKSVCINTIISSILFKAKPTDVKFLMIDPKMVELNAYNGIPHLIAPVVTDPKKASVALKWIVAEMENRYELFAAAGTRDIARYNEAKREKGEDESLLPYVLVIIDELADLMMVAPGEVEDSICRLAQMARAAGIHLVVATQRPSVDVITGLIKANIPSRISFAVSSQTDSRTILDMGGAEKLLGKGDMLYFPVGFPKPLRVQGAYLSEKEVEEICNFVRQQAQPEYEAGVFELDEKVIHEQEEDYDELFPEAVRTIYDTGQASISMLQRRLHIGYSRAARLVDLMEKKGIIGGFGGTKPREILLTREQAENIIRSME